MFSRLIQTLKQLDPRLQLLLVIVVLVSVWAGVLNSRHARHVAPVKQDTSSQQTVPEGYEPVVNEVGVSSSEAVVLSPEQQQKNNLKQQVVDFYQLLLDSQKDAAAQQAAIKINTTTLFQNSKTLTDIKATFLCGLDYPEQALVTNENFETTSARLTLGLQYPNGLSGVIVVELSPQNGVQLINKVLCPRAD